MSLCLRRAGLVAQVAGALLILFFTDPSFAKSEFVELDGPQNGELLKGRAHGMSADGSTVVGHSRIHYPRFPTRNSYESFRWAETDGMVILSDLAGGHQNSTAIASNMDGSAIVGHSDLGNGLEAFRWTEADGFVGLGDLPGGRFNSAADDVSADGSVVVGYSRSSVNGREAFRWTKTDGMVGLGDLAGGIFYSEARGVSADGSVVVGDGTSEIGGRGEAFRWTKASGMVGLGDLAGGEFGSGAHAVSADGSAVVGLGTSANGVEAFRWTKADGMVGLGDLKGGIFLSFAFDVSADGSVVVGYSRSARGDEAFRWLEGSGMQSVADLLANEGIDVGRWVQFRATGVSDDGRVIVGYGTNSKGQTKAWRAVIETGINSPNAGSMADSQKPSVVEPGSTVQFKAFIEHTIALKAGRVFIDDEPTSYAADIRGSVITVRQANHFGSALEDFKVKPGPNEQYTSCDVKTADLVTLKVERDRTKVMMSGKNCHLDIEFVGQDLQAWRLKNAFLLMAREAGNDRIVDRTDTARFFERLEALRSMDKISDLPAAQRLDRQEIGSPRGSKDANDVFLASASAGDTWKGKKSNIMMRSLAPGKAFKDCGDCPEMVVLPKGSFEMGDLNGLGGKYEQPVHRVTINYALAVGRFEVTFDNWAACIRDGACSTKSDGGWGRGNRPVLNANWHDAKQFTKWLSQKSGFHYRLLSEAEWEYAARAGTVTAYSFGRVIGWNRANCRGCGSRWDNRLTAPVGSFRPNPFGLYDMHGNVWEWTEDCQNKNYDGAPTDGGAWIAGNCKERGLRGGSFIIPPRYLRSAARFGHSSDYRSHYYGFRVARTIDP